MIRIVLIAALLAPLAARAQPAPLTFNPPAPEPLPPESPRVCAVYVTLRVTEGSSLKGPIEVAKSSTTGQAVLTLDTGFELKGPLLIEVCDGRVTISKGPPA
jgi:hypothetical protein